MAHFFPCFILSPQVTASYSGEEAVLEAKGRHDPCVLPRAPPLVEAMTALVLADLALIQRARCGGDPPVLPRQGSSCGAADAAASSNGIPQSLSGAGAAAHPGPGAAEVDACVEGLAGHKRKQPEA